MEPSSQIIAKRSTSGSTTKPTSAMPFFISSEIWVRLAGNGSGLCANCPVASQLSLMTLSTPNSSSSFGKINPPTEFTQSIATVKFSFLMAFLFTKSKLITSLMCAWV